MIYLRRIDPLRNMARFYVLDLQPTLFGEWALLKSGAGLAAAGNAAAPSSPQGPKPRPSSPASSGGGRDGRMFGLGMALSVRF